MSIPEIRVKSTIPIEGEILEHHDVSGVSLIGRHIIIGSDEGSEVQVLKKDGNLYQVVNPGIDLLDATAPEGSEVDIEAIAVDEKGAHYVLGSHSAKRKKVKESKSYKQNRKRIETIQQEPRRSSLFKLELNEEENSVVRIHSVDLSPVFESDPVLKVFNNIPSKENGIDLEGLAYCDGRLYLGFRGPVLRQNFVPVLVTSFSNPFDYEIRYVQLDGRGIRDMETVKDGFLIISGPVATGDHRFYIHFWNGEDEIPGHDRKVAGNKTLAEIIPPVKWAKAEGLALLEETDAHYKVIIIFDGAELKEFSVFEVKKQGS